MYAIVEIAGHQFKVEKDQKVFVNRLSTEEGKEVKFDNVLLIGDGDNITLGAPAIGGAQVGAKVLRHLKGDKVIVFKKKRRKGYRKKNGHRQHLSEIVVESIVASGAKKSEKSEAKAEKAAPVKKAEPKKEAAPKAEVKKEAPKAEAKKPEVKKAEAPVKEEAQKTPKKGAKKADDLTKLEGAGPKAAEALVAAGFDTFLKVAKAKHEDLSKALVDASSRLAHISTLSWPKQAEFAAEGKWDELKEYQDKLDGGVEK